GHFYAGVIYHHWAADSVSVRITLREWFFRVYDPARIQKSPVSFADGGLWKFFGPTGARWHLTDGILAALRLTSRFNTARPVRQEGIDGTVRCEVHPLPESMINHLKQAAHAHTATINDLFQAALAEACHLNQPTSLESFRHEMAIGTVVDLRPFSPLN